MVAALGARHPCRAGAIDDIQFQFPSSDNLAQAIGSQLGSDSLRLALGPRSAFWGVVADQPKHGVICPNSISIDDFDVRSRNRIDRQDSGTDIEAVVLLGLRQRFNPEASLEPRELITQHVTRVGVRQSHLDLTLKGAQEPVTIAVTWAAAKKRDFVGIEGDLQDAEHPPVKSTTPLKPRRLLYPRKRTFRPTSRPNQSHLEL